jgi:hypothetical protein
MSTFAVEFPEYKNSEIQIIRAQYSTTFDAFQNNPGLNTYTDLFNSHPFYRDAKLEQTAHHLICKFWVFNPDTRTWDQKYAAVAGTDTEALYKSIAKKLSELTQ